MKRINIIDDLFTEEEQMILNDEIEIMQYMWGGAKKRQAWVKQPQRNAWQFWSSVIYPTAGSKANATLVTVEELYKTYPVIMDAWDKISATLSDNYNLHKYEFSKIYTLAQFNSSDASDIHQDIGDLSILYYSKPNWNIEWDGGTIFYNDEITDCVEYVPYKSGRTVVFDAKIPHKGMSVSPKATELRTILAFKLRLKENGSN